MDTDSINYSYLYVKSPLNKLSSAIDMHFTTKSFLKYEAYKKHSKYNGSGLMIFDAKKNYKQQLYRCSMRIKTNDSLDSDYLYFDNPYRDKSIFDIVDRRMLTKYARGKISIEYKFIYGTIPAEKKIIGRCSLAIIMSTTKTSHK